MPISRRTLLGTAAAGAAAVSLPALATATEMAPRRSRPPKNIIFCVVDGMAASVMTMLDHLTQMEGRGRSYWSTLLDRPDVHRGWQDTRSLSSVVTDSSAASSAWGCGRHIWNGQLNIYPDGTELEPITVTMARGKVRCGLATTATVTHATPAGFAVSCLRRDDESLIAEKYLNCGVDVFLGGGDRFFSPKRRKDGRDMYAEFEKAGFAVVKEKGAMTAATGRKLLGVFSDSHIPFTVDRDNDPLLKATVPTLAEMSQKALAMLKGSPGGFLLQIEGARVDHGGHTNDLAAMIYDQRAFEDAVRTAIEFAEKDGETLVIITSDHATGGVALNGSGFEYFDSTAGLSLVSNMRSSYAPILTRVAASPKAETVRELLKARLDLEIKEGEAQAVADAAVGKFPYALSEFDRSPLSVLGLVIGNYTKVGFTSLNHTSDHVMVTAFGPWADRVSGLQPNVGFYNLMLASKGIKHENPTRTYEESKRAFDAANPRPPKGELQALHVELDAETGDFEIRH
ncbi:MAG: hypothetical protein C4320_05105 [Armatimonadota bacterium]